MEDLINRSKKLLDKKTNKENFGIPNISVIGIGGAGCNIITAMNKNNIKNIPTIAINTDLVHLSYKTEAEKKILIGKPVTHGLGAGNDPFVGEECADISTNVIRDVVRGTDLIFLVTGLGGGTGTGATQVIARLAKEEGAVVTSIVTFPFNFEKGRIMNAECGLQKLSKFSDSVVILQNEKLIKYLPSKPIQEAFGVMDQLCADLIKGLTETITQPALVNLDYADVKSIMKQGGYAGLMYGETSNGVEDAIKQTLSHPLLEMNYKNASAALIHITSGPEFTIQELEKICNGITNGISKKDIHVIWGAKIDNEMIGKIHVMAILTGVQYTYFDGRTIYDTIQNTNKLSQYEPINPKYVSNIQNIPEHINSKYKFGGVL